jgi:uncharacterized damage-inducible protein DinB
MDHKKMLIEEFNRRVFEESYSRIYRCLNLLTPEQIWTSPQHNIPPIGCLVLHLCGNARQWIVAGLGNQVDIRDRNNEFIPHPNIRKADLVFVLENLKIQVKESLETLDSKKFNQRIVIQGLEETHFSVIMHVLEHFSYHTGQITTLTKLFTGKETNYYSSDHLNDKTIRS